MHLVKKLPPNPLDIVGDVHGELDALNDLLRQLGYDEDGHHPQQRRLVFVGDLVDRGLDSYGVVRRVQRLMQNGKAYCVLGNHEINLLLDDVKDGSGWFFDERYAQDRKNYGPIKRTPPEQKPAVRRFLGGLPVALVRRDIRVVHAAWTREAIEAVRSVTCGKAAEQYRMWNYAARSSAQATGLLTRYLHEKKTWADHLESETAPPPFLSAFAEYETMQQMVNPLKVLTSGVEVPASEAFFAGNRWRFSDRVSWWEDYDEDTPVVFGHYWRLLTPLKLRNTPRYTQLFKHIAPLAWFGKRGTAFCVDYSAGARWRDRKARRPVEESRFRLAALQWPERQLVLDNGQVLSTTGFKAGFATPQK